MGAQVSWHRYLFAGILPKGSESAEVMSSCVPVCDQNNCKYHRNLLIYRLRKNVKTDPTLPWALSHDFHVHHSSSIRQRSEMSQSPLPSSTHYCSNLPHTKVKFHLLSNWICLVGGWWLLIHTIFQKNRKSFGSHDPFWGNWSISLCQPPTG